MEERAADQAAARAAADAHRRTAEERLLRIVSSSALRQVLPHKLSLARARAASCRSQSARFAEVSPAYRAALAGAGDPPGAVRSALDGVPWWMPPGSPPPRSPLHTISQTRDVGVGGVMIEVGAGSGITSVVRVALGDATAAYCTEPDAASYACLAANVVGSGLEGLVLPDRVEIGGTTPEARTLDQWVRDVEVDLDTVGFVQINSTVTGAVLNGARTLLERPVIVWQLEILPAALGADGVRDVMERITASFTHFIVVSTPPPGTRVRTVDSLAEIVAGAGGENVAVLLYSAAPQS